MARDVTLVVCAGGRSRRWGGPDKTAQPLAGRPVLTAVVAGALAGLTDAGLADSGPADAGRVAAVVVVAPPAHPARDAVRGVLDDGTALVWTLEDPPDGGPVAGLAAALVHVVTPWVVVLAGDAPFAGTALPRLVDAAGESGAQGSVGVDPTGVRQPMLAAYDTTALRTALGIVGSHGPHGASMRSLQALLTLTEVPVSRLEALDLDTPADLQRAEKAMIMGDSGAGLV